MCSGRIQSSCSSGGIHLVALVTNMVVLHNVCRSFARIIYIYQYIALSKNLLSCSLYIGILVGETFEVVPFVLAFMFELLLELSLTNVTSGLKLDNKTDHLKFKKTVSMKD
jgi:hypothetical protein